MKLTKKMSECRSYLLTTAYMASKEYIKLYKWKDKINYRVSFAEKTKFFFTIEEDVNGLEYFRIDLSVDETLYSPYMIFKTLKYMVKYDDVFYRYNRNTFRIPNNWDIPEDIQFIIM